MTTIAFDTRTLAVDRASWKSNYIWTPVCKLFQVSPGPACIKRFALDGLEVAGVLVWAAAGSAAEAPLVLEWMKSGGELPPIPTKEENTSRGLVLVPETRRIYGLTSLLTLEPFATGVPVADGGGLEMALGAMLAGKTAVEAIELVASRSSWAAGGVDAYSLPDDSPGIRAEMKVQLDLEDMRALALSGWRAPAPRPNA